MRARVPLTAWPLRAVGAPRRDGRALSAGLTAGLFLVLAPLPVQVALTAEMGLSDAQAARAISVVWATGAVASIVLCLVHRQPIAITWSVLGLVYLAAAAGRFTPSEIVGANVAAGVAILVLALAGAGERAMRIVPLPIVLGMFAGSILEYVTGAVAATAEDAVVAGSAVGSYLVARAIGSPRVPPVGAGIAAGVVALLARGQVGPVEAAGSAPSLGLPGISLSAEAILTVSPPLVFFALALGNVQGLGYLAAQGYRVPVRAVSVAIGVASIVNGLLGGHQASVGRATSAIVGGPDAGPLAGRWRSGVIAALVGLGIAAAAAPIVALVGALPPSFVAVVTGLAILGPFEDAMRRALAGPLGGGATTALVVAATPFTAGGVGSATWALVAGLAVSLACERQALRPAGSGQGRGADRLRARAGVLGRDGGEEPPRGIPPERSLSAVGEGQA